jgi:methylated-DNA-[protein]-cysteine S-methyltransferase
MSLPSPERRLLDRHSEVAFTLFDTAIGRCALAWTGQGVSTVRLPGRTSAATVAAVASLLPRASLAVPPPEIVDVLQRIERLVAGRDADALVDVPLDVSAVGDFERRVYVGARGVPPGSTVTYGQLADRIGAPGAARAVGRALARNRFPLIVPCHRVVAAGHKIGGFSAPAGISAKRQLLVTEARWRHGGDALW